jgi:peptide/nickel transport system substrate-binding protein
MDVRQLFHSSQIADGADNFVSYNNPEVDKLIDQARRTVDDDKRMPIWQEVHRILYDEQPYTFLYTRRSTALADKRLKNIQVLKIGLSDESEWYVPKAEQKWKE